MLGGGDGDLDGVTAVILVVGDEEVEDRSWGPRDLPLRLIPMLPCLGCEMPRMLCDLRCEVISSKNYSFSRRDISSKYLDENFSFLGGDWVANGLALKDVLSKLSRHVR